MLHTFAFDCEFGNAVEKEKISKNFKAHEIVMARFRLISINEEELECI